MSRRMPWSLIQTERSLTLNTMKPILTDACFHLKSAWQAVFLRSALTALVLAPVAAIQAADLLPPSPDSAAQVDRARKAGLVEIAPVHLPPPDAGDCNHYGWPLSEGFVLL
jgi:hypothetical protein